MAGSDTQNTDDELDDTGTAHIADLGGSADEVPFDSTDMDLLRGAYKAGDDLTVPDEVLYSAVLLVLRGAC